MYEWLVLIVIALAVLVELVLACIEIANGNSNFGGHGK